jgi:ABC-type multidrug transport system fused ATPase/permease subunit
LIERFYEPQSGEILLDGQPVQSITRGALRSQIGYALDWLTQWAFKRWVAATA